MFVTVKYGEEQQEIFNPGCRNGILLNCIKQRCQVNKEDVVELSDERGMIKNLRHFPQDYASSYLKNRETLILLRVENPIAALQAPPEEMTVEKAVFVPLLSSLMSNADFIDILNPVREEDTLSEASFKYRRRSSMQDLDYDGSRGGGGGGGRGSKQKGSTNHGSSATSVKKPTSRRGQRPPLRKANNTSSS